MNKPPTESGRGHSRAWLQPSLRLLLADTDASGADCLLRHHSLLQKLVHGCRVLRPQAAEWAPGRVGTGAETSLLVVPRQPARVHPPQPAGADLGAFIILHEPSRLRYPEKLCRGAPITLPPRLPRPHGQAPSCPGDWGGRWRRSDAPPAPGASARRSARPRDYWRCPSPRTIRAPSDHL